MDFLFGGSEGRSTFDEYEEILKHYKMSNHKDRKVMQAEI